MDELNKSITVIILENSLNGWPRPGQNTRLNIFAETAAPVIAIPVAALQYDGDESAVFVKKDALHYEKRLVYVRRITGENVILESGLESGEEVAVSQVFSLKALARYEEFAEE